MEFHVIAEDVLARARAAAGADEEHELTTAPGVPLRCCLRRAGAEAVVLFRYRPGAGRGPYAEVGPVYAHAERCAGPEVADGELPLFTAPRVLRAYTAEGRIHDGVLSGPGSGRVDLAALLADPAVARVQVRSATHGCFLFEVTGSAVRA
ncbi:DUF1203 domain-containing protein [Actinosynnema pretiosum]|uniref:DUF1203 domain-containing protein n=1 Tax=Actinosynnema pretiosum TaxID=42197 RepID=A0A290YZJ9_9PSEU|nr:DUF1203 domain-containing protein [Actinosynnema pretiosum]ATE52153.1 hypothetical protein CNX65_01650 [Actinosynnema pretiosum]